MALRALEILIGESRSILETIDQIQPDDYLHELEKDSTTAKLFKSLDQKFPHVPPGFTSLPAYKTLEPRAQELVEWYTPLYALMEHLHRWLETAYQVLYKVMNDFETISVVHTPILAYPYYRLLENYIRIAMLPSRLPQIRARLAMLARVRDAVGMPPQLTEEAIFSLIESPFTNQMISMLRSLSSKLRSSIIAMMPAAMAGRNIVAGLTDPQADASVFPAILLAGVMIPGVAGRVGDNNSPIGLLAGLMELLPVLQLTPSGKYSLRHDEITAITMKGDKQLAKTLRSQCSATTAVQTANAFIAKARAAIADGTVRPRFVHIVAVLLFDQMIISVVRARDTSTKDKLDDSDVRCLLGAAAGLALVDRLALATANHGDGAAMLDAAVREYPDAAPTEVSTKLEKLRGQMAVGEDIRAAWSDIESSLCQMRGIRRHVTLLSFIDAAYKAVAAYTNAHGHLPLYVLPHRPWSSGVGLAAVIHPSTSLLSDGIRDDVIAHTRRMPNDGFQLIFAIAQATFTQATELAFDLAGEAADTLAKSIVQAGADSIVTNIQRLAGHKLLAAVEAMPAQTGVTLPPKTTAALGALIEEHKSIYTELTDALTDLPQSLRLHGVEVDPAALIAGRINADAAAFVRSLMAESFPRPTVLLLVIQSYIAAVIELAPVFPVDSASFLNMMVDPSRSGPVVSGFMRAVDPFLTIHTRGAQPTVLYNDQSNEFSPAPDRWADRQQRMLGKPSPLQEVVERMTQSKTPLTPFKAALNAQLVQCQVDQVTERPEMRALVDVIGSEGTQYGAGELLRMAFSEVARCLNFLTTNESAVRTANAALLKGDAWDVSFQSAPELVQGLVFAGNAVILRDMLLDGAGIHATDLKMRDDAKTKCSHALGDRKTHHLWPILPVALAATLSSIPEQRYVRSVKGFRNNFHVAPCAAVMFCLNIADDGSMVQEFIESLARSSLVKLATGSGGAQVLVLLDIACRYAKKLGLNVSQDLVDRQTISLAYSTLN
ncbi:hypothetical protein J8273_2695 [Carpediemonas membranifera]|uniref:Uncharacterized protein n=1 Tax=Carpediemonas membranifera TaxID=201153 RepID=A0A8J6E3D4_9EUKA|nr:hypothetical protein J8273_2695 [Carpediemonas membranifera]|eukprot:KAG9395783.1 hypothetical protein J8273_2695 [Carpediemonas membranifera]